MASRTARAAVNSSVAHRRRRHVVARVAPPRAAHRVRRQLGALPARGARAVRPAPPRRRAGAGPAVSHPSGKTDDAVAHATIAAHGS